MTFRKSLTLWAVALFLPIPAFSCEMTHISEIEAITCGAGASLGEAKNDAIRQGIQYLVGSYVTSDLESNNEEITRDSVTDYSGAIADRFEIINQGQRADGLYEMTAHIWITRDASRQRNRAPIQSSGSVDGQSLQAVAISRVKQESDARNLWEDLLRGFPDRAFIYEVGPARIDTLPEISTKVKMTFHTTSFWREDFLRELYSLLKTTGHHEFRTPNGEGESMVCLQSDDDKDCYIIDVPTRLLKEMLCVTNPHFPSMVGVSFKLLGQGDAMIGVHDSREYSISQEPRRNAVMSPYVEYYDYTFHIANNDTMTNNRHNPEAITNEWYTIVSTDDLAGIKGIGAMANGCQ